MIATYLTFCISSRDELLKFHNTWYSSNIMSLAVLGKENLDDLQNMVMDLFNDVANKNIDIPSWTQHPYLSEDNRTITRIVPVKDIKEMLMLFPIPDISEKYKSGVVDYLTHLIAHEGRGSLLSELKRRKWCNSLYAYESYGAKGFSFLTITIADMTIEGIDRIDDIANLVFQVKNFQNNS